MKATLTDGVLNLVLDSPNTHNAFGVEAAKSLAKAIKIKNVKLIVLSAHGRVFCSGGQLKDYAKMKTKGQGLKLNRGIRSVLNLFANHSAPKIAVITGDCLGGGIELISCCDYILSEPQVMFGMWQRKMELSYGWGGYLRLKTRMSEQVLKTWLLTGDLKSALTVQKLGLVTQVTSNINKDLEILKSKLLSFDNTSYEAIHSRLSKNETQLFEDLWWSQSHQNKLKKYL